MKQHVHTVHEGHKDYKCDTCGKSFTQTKSLKTHIHNVHVLEKHIHVLPKEHSDEQNSYNATCYLCGKSFKHKISLEKHIHTGRKDYACDS